MEKNMEESQYRIGKICVHEIDTSTVKLKRGFSQGRCKKCSMTLTRLYTIETDPTRTRGHFTKKQRRKRRLHE